MWNRTWCVQVHELPKAIVVKTVRSHSFHDYIYITLILLQWDLSTLFFVNHLWPLILHSCFACSAFFGSLVPAMWNHTSRAQVPELPQSHCGDNRECTLFSWLHICYPHLASVRFEHCVCRGSHMVTDILRLALLVEDSFFHWYQQYWTLHLVPKCMSCHKAIVVINERAHFFHDYMYIMLILLLWDLITLCVVDHLWPLILWSWLCLFSIIWFIGTSNVEPYIMCLSAWVGTKPLWW